LSQAAAEAILNELKSPDLANEQFQFDVAEFKIQAGFRSVELDNGGILTADSGEFDNVFQREVVDDRTLEVRYSTKGRVVNERLRRASE
jgi:hypothetical protein